MIFSIFYVIYVCFQRVKSISFAPFLINDLFPSTIAEAFMFQLSFTCTKILIYDIQNKFAHFWATLLENLSKKIFTNSKVVKFLQQPF